MRIMTQERPKARDLAEAIEEVANALLVEMPRYEHAVWEAILDADEDPAGWTYYDLKARLPALAPVTINTYLSRLRKAGIVREVAMTRNGSSLYQVAARPAEAPRLRADGTPQYSQLAREQMWRAMKMIGWWTPRDLAIAASTDLARVSERTARMYASHLFRAGFLFWRASAGLYRLKTFMDKGPIPPKVMRTTFVWDSNIQAIVGRGTATEEIKI